MRTVVDRPEADPTGPWIDRSLALAAQAKLSSRALPHSRSLALGHQVVLCLSPSCSPVPTKLPIRLHGDRLWLLSMGPFFSKIRPGFAPTLYGHCF